MTELDGVASDVAHHEDMTELHKEALTMALYVAICLLAALTATTEAVAEDHALTIIWGTTIGLALAHWFAFRVSARLVAAGAVRRHDALAAIAQLLGAAFVALLATAPVLILPGSTELEVVQFVLAGFIAVVGYAVARSADASQWRSIGYAMTLLVSASVVVVIKIALSGH